MGNKAVQKREYILQQAEKVFFQKGFKNVTMKDIVAACHISRGGVYLYFSDTKEIFEAVLQARGNTEPALVRSEEQSAAHAATGVCAGKQLRQFLEAQKAEILHPAESLIIATYEYLFAQSEVLSKAELERNFQNAVHRLEPLLQSGVEHGEFRGEAADAAAHIVLFLEGLRISSTVLTFEESFLDRQIAYLLSQLEGGEQA